ncbi:GNAT family N-acetyltransferase [Actinosynnema sp. NPDC023587]|uniref:GNAT family N-acetyltransferase n=1 Tax=Actinosynnema sp. NPDC023587 TaxID=3154695 RepID=UPI00340C8D01
MEAARMTGSPVRPANPEDADKLLRLRVAAFDGTQLTDDWWETFRNDMRDRLGTDPDLLAFVVPAPDGTLASCAIGIVYRCYRGPTHPAGQWARIHTVATHPAHRRHGHARAVTTTLVHTLRQRGCDPIELRATKAGTPLYRSLGFDLVDNYMTLRSGATGILDTPISPKTSP